MTDTIKINSSKSQSKLYKKNNFKPSIQSAVINLN